MLIDGLSEVKVDYRAHIQKASRRWKKLSQVPCSVVADSKEPLVAFNMKSSISVYAVY
jgi:hypothetical protein